jgi:hypothetical protein
MSKPSLWISWVFISMAGTLIGLSCIIIPLVSTIEMSQVICWCVLSLSGIPLAVGEWLLLRRELGIKAWWVLTTTLSWALCWYINIFLILTLSEVTVSSIAGRALLYGLFPGLIFGTCQWLVLRRRFDKSIWWIFATMAGWDIALFGLVVFFRTMQTNLIATLYLYAIPGVTQGLALVWMPRREKGIIPPGKTGEEGLIK